MTETQGDKPMSRPGDEGGATIGPVGSEGRPATDGALVGEEELVIHEGRQWIRYTRVGFAGLLFVLGLFIFAQSFEFGWESRGTPGPGYFPFWVGLLIALTSFAWGITELRSSIDAQFQQDIDPEGVWRVAQIVAAFAVLLIIFEPVGYNLSVLAFMMYLTYSMGKGKGRIWVMVVTSLAASFGVYLVFVNALGVRLPKSIIPILSELGL